MSRGSRGWSSTAPSARRSTWAGPRLPALCRLAVARGGARRDRESRNGDRSRPQRASTTTARAPNSLPPRTQRVSASTSRCPPSDPPCSARSRARRASSTTATLSPWWPICLLGGRCLAPLGNQRCGVARSPCLRLSCASTKRCNRILRRPPICGIRALGDFEKLSRRSMNARPRRPELDRFSSHGCA